MKLPFITTFAASTTLAWAAPAISNEAVSDITSAGFSVIWNTNEAATASIEVFSDPGGTTPVATAVITPHPTDNESGAVREAAEDIGVMKVGVANLDPDTTYYYRTVSTSKGDFTSTTGPLNSAHTATMPLLAALSVLTPVSNPLIKFDIYLPDGTTPADGGMLIVDIPGAASPVTAFAGGSGAGSPTAIVDLNNLFDDTTGNTLTLAGGEEATFTIDMGSSGREEFTFYLPENGALPVIRDPQLTPNADDPPIIQPRITSAGVAQVFLDFPVTEGQTYEVRYADEAGVSGWTTVSPALIADGFRLFWEDHGEPETASPPSMTPRRLYRLRENND